MARRLSPVSRTWQQSERLSGSMEYENRQPAEGINVTNEHPLKKFFTLLVGAAVLIVLLVVVLQFVGGSLAKLVPLRYEVSALEKIEFSLFENTDHPEIESYLNELATRLSPYLDIPEDVSLKIHYGPEDQFNAFATLGANVLFYKGMLEAMPHENALAMVVAHEISHVVHRDPIVGLGGGLSSGMAIKVLLGDSGSAGTLLQTAGSLTSVQFTRKMEIAADTKAIAAIYQLYGHVNGADELFRAIALEREESALNATWLQRFESTHPLDQDRIAAISKIANTNNWPVDGRLTPLPDAYSEWLND